MWANYYILLRTEVVDYFVHDQAQLLEVFINVAVFFFWINRALFEFRYLLDQSQPKQLVVFLGFATLQGEWVDARFEVVNGELEAVDFVKYEEVLKVLSTLLGVVIEDVS